MSLPLKIGNCKRKLWPTDEPEQLCFDMLPLPCFLILLPLLLLTPLHNYGYIQRRGIAMLLNVFSPPLATFYRTPSSLPLPPPNTLLRPILVGGGGQSPTESIYVRVQSKRTRTESRGFRCPIIIYDLSFMYQVHGYYIVIQFPLIIGRDRSESHRIPLHKRCDMRTDERLCFTLYKPIVFGMFSTFCQLLLCRIT